MEINKTIPVHFDEWQKTQYNKGDLVQWDRGMWLDISGLDISSENVEVHFSLEEVSGDAMRRVGTVENGVISVKVPAFILEGPEYIYGDSYCAWAWVYVSDEESAETIRKICFTIGARPKPEDYVRDEEEVKLWSTLEEKIEDVNKDLQSTKEKQDFVARYGVTSYSEIKEAYERGCDVRVKYKGGSIKKLEAGTYDADGNLLQTWDELNYNIEESTIPPNNLLWKLDSNTHTLVIPDGIKTIGKYQLYRQNNIEIKSLILPESLREIGANALGYQQSLESIAIPNSVTNISSYQLGTQTFLGCNNLKTIYYSGTATGSPWGAGNATILPYEEAPNEALGIIGSSYELLGSLELIDNDFVFYTTKGDMPLKIVCNADGWSSEEIEYAKPDDIPKKVSELVNDLPTETFIAEYNKTTYEQVLKAIQEKKHVYLNYQNERFACLSRIDGDINAGECNFLFTCFENTIEHSYLIQNATKEWSYYSCDCGNYIRQFGSDIVAINKKLPFVATYGVTTYEEVLKAYQENKGIILNVSGAQVENGLMDLSMTLARVDNNNDNSTDRYTFTFCADENGVAHYASINWDTKTWNYWNYNYALNITGHDESIVSLNNQVADLRKLTTNYKREEIPANGKFQLREKGLYIFGGSDYDLNLCRANGDTVGKTKALVVIVFCTEADKTGAFRVYVMQNYKTLGMPSMDGMPYDGFTRDYYIHNTNGSAGAYVYYMRQNELETE